MKIKDILNEKIATRKTGPATRVKDTNTPPQAEKDRNMSRYAKNLVDETSSAGVTSAASIATAPSLKAPKKKRMAKNALDQKSGSIFAVGGASKK